jgi:hypothetical protein
MTAYSGVSVRMTALLNEVLKSLLTNARIPYRSIPYPLVHLGLSLPVQHSNRIPSEYEVELVSTTPRHSVARPSASTRMIRRDEIRCTSRTFNKSPD